MKVLKFGGTSIGSPENIGKVCQIIRKKRHDGLVLVFSAMGDTTDRLTGIGETAAQGHLEESLASLDRLRDDHLDTLLRLLKQESRPEETLEFYREVFHTLEDMVRSISVLGDLSLPVKDRFLGYGELLSTRILQEIFLQEGLPVTWMDARDLIVTSNRHTQAEPIFSETARRCQEILTRLLKRGEIPITQGFISRSISGSPTTLGRGGSDYTASLIGAALDAEEIEIWTDVDGIMTADPSLVPGAGSIPEMSFEEASELAFFGARVLHPKTLAPAVERGIPIRVLNTRRPEGAGTVITKESSKAGPVVKSIAYKEGMTLLHLVSTRMFQAQGFLRRLFQVFERHDTSPDVVATSEVSVAIAIWDTSQMDDLLTELRDFGTVRVRPAQAVVSVVGEGIRETNGIVSRVFGNISDIGVSLVSQGGSEINLSFVIDESDLPVVVRRLHRHFFEEDGLSYLPREGTHG